MIGLFLKSKRKLKELPYKLEKSKIDEPLIRLGEKEFYNLLPSCIYSIQLDINNNVIKD